MAVADRHARAGHVDRDRLVAEDLARLEHQLALLVGVVVAVGEVAGAAQDVERDRVRVDLGGRHRLAAGGGGEPAGGGWGGGGGGGCVGWPPGPPAGGRLPEPAGGGKTTPGWIPGP